MARKNYFKDPIFYWSWAFILFISLAFGWGISWMIPCVSIPGFALIYWLMRNNP